MTDNSFQVLSIGADVSEVDTGKKVQYRYYWILEICIWNPLIVIVIVSIITILVLLAFLY